MALLLLGMIVPSLSNAYVAPQAEVKLDPVLINSPPTSTTFTIQNQNEESTITLYFNLQGTCGFTYDTGLQGAVLAKKGEENDAVTMTVHHDPIELGVCSDTLTVQYFDENFSFDQVDVILTAEVVDQLGPSTVIIDGYDTGVENRLNDEKPISEHLALCEENANNHGQYVKCVAHLTRKMRRAKVLDKHERRKILKAAAFANIPPIEEGLEGLEYDGTPVVALINECKEDADNKKEYRRCVRKLIKKMRRAGIKMSRDKKKMMLRYVVRLQFRTEWER